MTNLINWLADKGRGLAATLGFGGVGYAARAEQVQVINEIPLADQVLQYIMWIVAIITGVFTLLGQIQKQLDRRAARKRYEEV